MSPAPAGGLPARGTAASEPSGPGPVVTPPTAVPLTVSGAPSYIPDQAAMSGSAAMLRAAGAVDVPNRSLVMSASQVTPYSRGVASKYPRLALNPRAALSPMTPTAVAAIADRSEEHTSELQSR